MPRFTPKVTADEEPMGAPCYPWIDWALARIRKALAAGGPPPQFRRNDPWSWILLSSAVDRDAELRDRAFIDIRERRVRWEQADGDDEAA